MGGEKKKRHVDSSTTPLTLAVAIVATDSFPTCLWPCVAFIRVSDSSEPLGGEGPLFPNEAKLHFFSIILH